MYAYDGHKWVNSKPLPSYCNSHTTPSASILSKSKHMFISMQIIPNMNEVQRRWRQ